MDRDLIEQIVENKVTRMRMDFIYGITNKIFLAITILGGFLLFHDVLNAIEQKHAEKVKAEIVKTQIPKTTN